MINECLQPALACPSRMEMLILPFAPMGITRLLELVEIMGWSVECTQKATAAQFTGMFDDGPKTWSISRLDATTGEISRSPAPGQWKY